jgi:hypothetical protein
MMSVQEPFILNVKVSGIDRESFDRVKDVARGLGIMSDAAVVRFVIEQFLRGRSINDYDGSNDEPASTASSGSK